jgi:hypothetical protein
MNLVKWFRKNRTKVMAVVVIVILFGFIGGSTFLSFLSKRSSGLHKTVAYFGDNRKITNFDIVTAREELRILEAARAGDLLRNIGVQVFRTADLRTLLLGELLFSERRTSPALINFIKRTVRTNNFRISDKQIGDIYRHTVPAEVYWHCLKMEAQLAGIRVSKEDTRRLLVEAIPQIPQLNGATYFQLMGYVIKQLGIPEEKILTVYSKLLAIMEFAKMSCSGEDITTSQIMQAVSREGETIDVNFVELDSAVFAETQSEPNQEKIVEHFNKYRNFFAGDVNEGNPYGFGYKLLDRVQVEYIACKLDDISKIVTPPTPEEAEEFYQRNRGQFTEEVLSDPNDPNSPLTERTKSYAEVASIISNRLLQNKISSKAKSILDEAKALTESGLQDIDNETEKLSVEQLKQKAGDYKAAAEQLSKENKIKIYTGKTGLLDAAGMQLDDYLGRLYLRSYGQTVVGLTQIVFAIEELGLSDLGPFDVSKPRMYKNIGPLGDMLERIVAVVRVIEVEKASVPEDMEHTFSTSSFELFTEDEQTDGEDPNGSSKKDSEDQNVYSVKEKVTEDLKKLAAMDVAKKKAEEFISMTAEDGWENTIEKFNELYGQQGSQDGNDPNLSVDPNTTEGSDKTFTLESALSLQRISRETIERLALQSEGNPGVPLFVNEAQRWLSVIDAKTTKQFIEQLYSLVPQDSNSIDNLPRPMEFKPGMSYYCIQSVRVRRVFREEYEQIKPMQVYKEEHIQSQSLAAVHFNPENILKRTNFRWVMEKKPVTDANTPAEPGEAS